jgi:CheY-like chemotaxis protein
MERSDALASNLHKSSFLANMSHEIRTPMNSIIGFSNLLASNAVPEDQKKEFINYIQSSGEQLLNLIDDIIDISKIEAGEIKINKKECNLNQILEELRITFENHKNKTAKTNLDLRLNISENSNLIIKTDSLRLRQILVNLISNAIKFTDEGFVEFGYTIHNKKILEFYVKDTGIGLSRSELDIIFERFKRTKITEQRDISGTGLGLAISKNLVKLLGGEMWVNSVMEEGTTFYFTIPLIRVGKINEKAIRQDDVPEEYHWKNKTILVAEDDDSSYMFIREIMIKTGARFIRAENGKQVADIVKKHEEIDLILMDVLLPEMDGYEATRNVKKLFPDLPVIAQTAFAMEGDKEKSILAGCDDYITKPLHVKNLLAKINQFIHRRHPQPYKKPTVKNNDESVTVTVGKKEWKDQMN